MIAIINTGDRDDSGAHRYRLQINQQLIAEFTHRQADGLAACLQRAAEAAEAAEAARQRRIDRFLAVALQEWRLNENAPRGTAPDV